jgi:hypothetical protein
LGQDQPAQYGGGEKKMRHTALLNPFSLSPEPVQIVSRQEQVRIVSRPATRSTPVCSRCESDDIISHVTAQWSNEQQQWELANTFDRPAHCNFCNGPCEIRWVAL